MDKRGDIGPHTPVEATDSKQAAASTEQRANHVTTRLGEAAEKRARQARGERRPQQREDS